MNQSIRAIYENGILRPLTPLDLEEHSVVDLSIVGSDEGSILDAVDDLECDDEDEEYVPYVVEDAVPGEPEITWEEVQAMLAKLPGSLSDDIDREREERF